MTILNLIYSVLKDSWDLLLNVAPFLLLGFAIAGLLHSFLGGNFIRKHLGKGRFSSVLKSVFFGIPLPVCSCGVIPIAASLKREGAKKSSVLAFLYATPTTGVDSILATYAFLGIIFAIFRPVASLVGGLLIGAVALKIEKEEGEINEKQINTTGNRKNLGEALKYGFLYLPNEIGKWIIIGVLIGGAITAMVPKSLFTAYLSKPYISYPLMLAVSIPLYVCATGSIPIAAALIWKGLNPGAALAFLIAGPATNAITITFVLKDLGKKFAALYITGIAVTATAFGLLFDFIWKMTGENSSILMGGGKYIPDYLKIASAIIFIALLLVSKIKSEKIREVKNMKIKFRVPNMTCIGCVEAIKNSISNLKEVKDIVIDLKSKEVMVDTELPPEEIEEAIVKAGYTVEEKEVL